MSPTASLPAFLPPRRRFVLEWEADLQVVTIDYQPDSSLLRLPTHVVEELPQLRRLPLDRLLARVALDDDRLIEQQPPALGIVAPDASALRESRRPAEQRPQDAQRLVDPMHLVDRPVIAIPARDEQHQQR